LKNQSPKKKNYKYYARLIYPSILFQQIQENIEYFTSYLKAEGFKEIRSCLAIGGVPSSEALEVIRRGVHILVATPGR
jgi:ATP-dependent RNA helicase DDX41